MVEAATLQWISGQTFGVAFFQVTDNEQQRLRKVRMVSNGSIKP
jgi:hypothetical protein